MAELRGGVVAVQVALAAGVATSFLQTVLPHHLAPLANSAGSWCVVAFVVAGLVRRTPTIVLVATAGLLALVAGYYLASAARGFGVNPASVLVWVVLGVLVGPVLGLARAWLRASGVRRLVGALVLPAFLVAEGVWALRTVAATTSSAYWVGEVAVGLLLAVVLARPWTARPGVQRA